MKKILLLFLVIFTPLLSLYAQEKTILHGVVGDKNLSKIKLTQSGSRQILNLGTAEIGANGDYSLNATIPGITICDASFYSKEGRKMFSRKIYVAPGKKIGMNYTSAKKYEFFDDYAKENSEIMPIHYKLSSATIGVLKNVTLDNIKKVDTFQKEFTDSLRMKNYAKDFTYAWETLLGHKCDMARMKALKGGDATKYKKYLSTVYKKNITTTDIFNVNDWQYDLDYLLKEMESAGLLPSTDIKNENRLKWIKNPIVRSEYGLYLLNNEIGSKKWMEKSIDPMVEKYKEYITADYSKKGLEECLAHYAKTLKDFFKLMPGEVAPPFTFESVDGKMISLSDYRGKFVILDVWNIYCGPCIKQVPFIKEMEKELESKNVYFIGVSCDPQDIKDKWKDMVKKKEMSGVQLIMDNGRHSRFLKDYVIHGFPTFVLIDPDGKIINAFFERPDSPNFKKRLYQHIDEYNSKNKK